MKPILVGIELVKKTQDMGWVFHSQKLLIGLAFATIPAFAGYEMDEVSIGAMADCQAQLIALKRPFFYRLERDGKSSFILGSRHSDISLQQMPGYVRSRMNEVDRVVFEILLREDPILMNSLANGLDQGVWRWATLNDIEKADLEPINKARFAWLQRFREEVKAEGSEADDIGRYLSGEEQPYQAQLQVFQNEYPELYRMMVKDRHAAWWPKMLENHSRDGQTLFVVGVAHLFGPDGLLKKFQNSGFLVKRIESYRD